MSCCCIDVDVTCDVISEHTVRRARKAHFCCECWRVIPPGASYRKEVTVSYDGGIEEYKTCILCWNIRQDRMTCGFCWGELWIGLRECMREFGEDSDNSWLDLPDWPILPEVAP